MSARRPEPAIRIEGLTKNYGALAAVRDLNLEVQAGEVVGFLGVNGAGKSTTIRILLDLLRPTRGAAFVFGHNCRTDSQRTRALIGYSPGEIGIYGNLTGKETLDFLAGLGEQKIDPRFRSQLQERLQLPDSDLRRKLREYSTGMKRKLGLIQAMQADPPLLILDEPSEGLDPLMREALYGLLADAHKKGRTIFMSSHVLSEVEQVCHQIALLRQGELVMVSSVQEISKTAPRNVRVSFLRDVPPLANPPPGHVVVQISPREWRLRVEGPVGTLLQSLAALPVLDMSIDEPRLEDVLIKYYREGRQ